MALPVMTPEQRAAALEKGAAARRARAAAKNALRGGETTLTAVLYDKDSPLQAVRVKELLRSLPSVGPVRTRRVMERIGIIETRRIRGLSDRQRQALKDEFEPAFA